MHVPEVFFGSNADRSIESSQISIRAESLGALMENPAISLEGIAKILTNSYLRVKSLKNALIVTITQNLGTTKLILAV